MTNNEVIKFLQSKQMPQCGDKEYTADEEYEAYQRAIDLIDAVDTVFDKIIDEIDRQAKWLSQAGYATYNVDIAMDTIKSVVVRSRAESEECENENFRTTT